MFRIDSFLPVLAHHALFRHILFNSVSPFPIPLCLVSEFHLFHLSGVSSCVIWSNNCFYFSMIPTSLPRLTLTQLISSWIASSLIFILLWFIPSRLGLFVSLHLALHCLSRPACSPPFLQCQLPPPRAKHSFTSPFHNSFHLISSHSPNPCVISFLSFLFNIQVQLSFQFFLFHTLKKHRIYTFSKKKCLFHTFFIKKT